MSTKASLRLQRAIAGVVAFATAAATIYGLYEDKRIAILGFVGMVFAAILVVAVQRAIQEFGAPNQRFYDLIVKILAGFVVAYFIVLAIALGPALYCYLTGRCGGAPQPPLPPAPNLEPVENFNFACQSGEVVTGIRGWQSGSQPSIILVNNIGVVCSKLSFESHAGGYSARLEQDDGQPRQTFGFKDVPAGGTRIVGDCPSGTGACAMATELHPIGIVRGVAVGCCSPQVTFGRDRPEGTTAASLDAAHIVRGGVPISVSLGRCENNGWVVGIHGTFGESVDRLKSTCGTVPLTLIERPYPRPDQPGRNPRPDQRDEIALTWKNQGVQDVQVVAGKCAKMRAVEIHCAASVKGRVLYVGVSKPDPNSAELQVEFHDLRNNPAQASDGYLLDSSTIKVMGGDLCREQRAAVIHAQVYRCE